MGVDNEGEEGRRGGERGGVKWGQTMEQLSRLLFHFQNEIGFSRDLLVRIYY